MSTIDVCDFCKKNKGNLQKLEVSFADAGKDVETFSKELLDICADCKVRLVAFLLNGCHATHKRSEKKKKE